MAAVDSSTDRCCLHIESLPLVDLRLLSQSELYSLSLCSSSHIHRRYEDDAIIPKIDRSVFNESAGSRKQTFSRLRLAPRNNQISSVSANTIQIPRHNPEPIDEENAQIIGLLQQLFGVESYGNVRHDDGRLVPVQVQFQDPPPESATMAFHSIPIDIVDVSQSKRKRGRPRKNENVGIRIEEKPRKEGTEAMTLVNNNGVFVDALALENVEDPFGEELKRRTQDLETESATVAFQNIPVHVAGGQKKRKRGRPRKNEIVAINVEEKSKEDGGEAMTMVNNDGVLVDAVALVNAEDPFGEELKRRTLGLETESQLLEFMARLNGEWASQRKKRRIVQAGDFGDILPRGWKIMLSLKRRAGRVWIICRRYISPDGHQFVSCKEVSSYLLSCFGLQDINHFKSGHTAGSLQFFGKMEHENPGVGSIATNEMKAVDVASSLFSPSISVFPDHVKQATVSSIGSDENVNNDLASGIKGQGVNNTGGTFANCNHQQSSVVDELPLRADKNGTISVLGCSPEKDRVGNIDNKKLVDDNDVACKLDVPLDVTTSFCNNKNNGNCEIFDEITAVQCLKSAISNFVEDSETIPCGNGESCFKSNGYVEDPQKLIGFERGIFVPNFEGKSCGADKLEEVNISDGNPFENDEWLINSGNCNSETEDVLTSFKLHCSSEGFSVVPSQTDLKHASINSMNRIDCLDIDPNVKVSKDVVENFARETISLNEQSLTCKMDNPLSRRFEENLVPPTGDEPLSAFDDNSIMVPSGTLETLKAVESGNKNPQLDIVISNNNAAVDAYSTTSIMQGRSQGCVSEPFSSSIRDKFEEQDHVGVNNADKFCSTEMAKGEQVKIYENDEAFLSFDRNQIESDVNVTNGAWNKI